MAQDLLTEARLIETTRSLAASLVKGAQTAVSSDDYTAASGLLVCSVNPGNAGFRGVLLGSAARLLAPRPARNLTRDSANPEPESWQAIQAKAARDAIIALGCAWTLWLRARTHEGAATIEGVTVSKYQHPRGRGRADRPRRTTTHTRTRRPRERQMPATAVARLTALASGDGKAGLAMLRTVDQYLRSQREMALQAS